MFEERIEEIARDYSRVVEADYIGLWQIVIRVRHELGVIDRKSNKEAVLSVVRQMLSIGFDAVTLDVLGPEHWQNQEADYVLNRISSEWDKLGDDPNPGDIVWFDCKRASKDNPANH